MNICITGSSGFIGKAIKEYLKANTIYNIIDFDLPDCDLLDPDTYPKQDISIIIHTAAVADLNETKKNIEYNYDINVTGSANIAMWANRKNAKLLYISTCCVWGDCDKPSVEDSTLPKTQEPYAVSKLAGEYAIKSILQKGYMIYRIGTVYGEGMRLALFNRIAIDSIIKGHPIFIHGDGKQDRQYIHIDDLVRAFADGINFWQDTEIFNICGVEKTSVIDTINTVEKLTDKAGKTDIGFIDNRKYQIGSEDICIKKAEKLLKWKPLISYKQGMKKTIEWVKGLK